MRLQLWKLYNNEKIDFMEKYDSTPPVNRSIDRTYFLKSYSYGFLIFASWFILLLFIKNDEYLSYILASFIFYPLAKVLFDWLFGFKLRHRINKQKSGAYYLEQLLFVINLVIFHISILLAPFGILFLLIRIIVIRVKR